MKRLIFFGVLFLCLFFTSRSTRASYQLLPLPPNPLHLSQIINQVTGLPFEPLGTPTLIINQLGSFTGIFSNIENLVDFNQSVHYISSGSALKETVIPLAGNALLSPDVTLHDGASGKIIGVSFQPSQGTRVMVAVFPCSNCSPDKIRFYSNSTSYTEKAALVGQHQVTNSADLGSVVGHNYSCVTVGMNQVCWDMAGRNNNAAKNAATTAYQNLSNVYSFQTQFHLNDALPDVLGHTQRITCRLQLQTALLLNFLPLCQPNLVFAPAVQRDSSNIIGIFVVQSLADVRTYRASDGVYIGGLPAGEYLVVDATPNVTTPGAVGALHLLNADGVNHYLIPHMVMNGTTVNKPQAAIKDGYVWGRGFGY